MVKAHLDFFFFFNLMWPPECNEGFAPCCERSVHKGIPWLWTLTMTHLLGWMLWSCFCNHGKSVIMNFSWLWISFRLFGVTELANAFLLLKNEQNCWFGHSQSLFNPSDLFYSFRSNDGLLHFHRHLFEPILLGYPVKSYEVQIQHLWSTPNILSV